MRLTIMQVQHFAGLTFTPKIESENNTNAHILGIDQLPNFVNSAEWSLGEF